MWNLDVAMFVKWHNCPVCHMLTLCEAAKVKTGLIVSGVLKPDRLNEQNRHRAIYRHIFFSLRLHMQKPELRVGRQVLDSYPERTVFPTLLQNAVTFGNHRLSSATDTLAVRFGHRLRDLRKTRGLTQVQLAARFGIDRSFISDVERGRKSISLSYLETIAQGFEIPLEQLMRGL